ncbi:MAG: type II secretion system F family protein [Phycisphaerae bacterium]|nr:type II secretion system F family protein [Phycisphaerae bacterium]NUQ46180.1 type II secretion system F family protein [Phycisphaerae bacterium]
MPTFVYEAMNAAGQEVKDQIEAVSTEDAIARIRNLGYFPTKIKQKGGAKPAQKAAGPAKRKQAGGGINIGGVSTKKLTAFTRQLSTLQDAGLPILRSLRILEQQEKPGLMRVTLRTVADDVEAGTTLSEAMSRHPKVFDRLYVNMVAAGEAGGVLDVILQRLADFMEKAQKLRRKVIGAMIYPVVVICVALLIVTGIMYFVVPKFREIFKDFGTELPGPTVLLMKMSDFILGRVEISEGVYRDMMVPGWAIVLFSPVGVFIFFKLLKKFKGGRTALDVVKLKVPILGNILSKTSIARFTRTLGTLVSAGVPILEALIITRDTCGNAVYERALQNVHDAIREGDSFANPLRASKVVDSIVVNMVDVGEETGDLDKMLIKVADNYDDEVETLVAGLVSLLEPIMVVVLGLIVGFIVISLFLPLVSLINSLSSGGGGS